MLNPKSPYGNLTISIGLAVEKPNAHGEPASLVVAADKALYRAKEAGRNQYLWTNI